MSKKVLFKGLDFAPFQEDFVYATEQYQIIIAATQVGKTISMIQWLLSTSLGENPYVTIRGCKNPRSLPPKEKRELMEHCYLWWVAPVFAQARIAFDRMCAIVGQDPAFKITKNPMEIRTPLGSVIQFKSADDPEKLYGESLTAVVLDEFTRMKKEVYQAVHTRTIQTNGYIRMIGNYTGGTNWGSRLASEKKSDPNWYVDTIPITAAVEGGIMDAEVVEEMRRTFPKAVFDALCMCQGNIDEMAVYDMAAVNNLWVNHQVEYLQGSPSTRYITADLAFKGSDAFSYLIWEGNILLDIIKIEKSSGKEVLLALKKACDSWNVFEENCFFDSTGVGAYLEGFDNNFTPVNFSSKATEGKYRNLRAECYFKSAKKVLDGKYYIKADRYRVELQEDLLAQLRKEDSGNRWQMESKKVIKQILGRSPDLADAFMMHTMIDIKGFSDVDGEIRDRHSNRTSEIPIVYSF